jgi:O-antigen biosynthesis protein
VKPRILWLWRQESAVAYYRATVPARWLTSQGYSVTMLDRPYERLKPSFESWVKANLGKFDLLIVDRVLDLQDLSLLSGLRHYSPNMRMVVDFDDDWQSVPWWNPAHAKYKPGCAAFEAGKAHLKLAETASVSTQPLLERFSSKTHDIHLCQNSIDPADWSLSTNPQRHNDPHLRVLYGGASGHFGDLDEVRLGLESVIQNPPVPFRLICFGALPAWLHELGREFPKRVVRLPWVPFADYPQATSWGGFDVAIAPLADHPFNEAKSNIKWLEAAVQGIPFLASDVGPYKDIPFGTAIKVSNTPIQWAEGLRQLLTDADLRDRLRTRAREEVLENWTIDKKASQWLSLIEAAMSRPRIETLEDIRLPSEIVVQEDSS